MKKLFSIVGIIGFCVLLPFHKTIGGQLVYNPQVQVWLTNADQTAKQVQRSEDKAIICPDDDDWKTFEKSFLSYRSYLAGMKDSMRNDCLREDIAAIKDKLKEISLIAKAETKKCNAQMALLEKVYADLYGHMNGLRKYGSNTKAEQGDQKNCPNQCRKTDVVGENNIDKTYYSEIYTEEQCPLSQQKSQKLEEAWSTLKESMNFYKQGKKQWKDESSGDVSSAKLEKSKNQASGWWDQIWDKYYSYNSKQPSQEHLEDREKSMMGATRLEEKDTASEANASQIETARTVKELAKEEDKQLNLYSQLNQEQTIEARHIDLSTWKSEMEYYYKIKRNSTADLENYLIDINNSIKNSTHFIDLYKPNLTKIVCSHCQNIYTTCAE